MKGVALLTVPRSGSEWLGSLANATGSMGCFGEWLDPDHLKFVARSYDELESAVLKAGLSENGRFAIKLFPGHLRETREKFEKDFLFEMLKKHEIGLIFLERRDRLRQAISYYRASVSRQWTNRARGTGAKAAYDFAEISRACISLEDGYSFWSKYLDMLGLPHKHVVYEEMFEDPTPFLEAVAEHMGVAAPAERPASSIQIQRDGLTEEWAERFRSDAAANGIIDLLLEERPAVRTLSNLRRFFKKRPLTKAYS